MANTPVDILPYVEYVILVFLHLICNIPMKWEPHGSQVVWGESVLTLTSDTRRLWIPERCLSLPLSLRRFRFPRMGTRGWPWCVECEGFVVFPSTVSCGQIYLACRQCGERCG